MPHDPVHYSLSVANPAALAAQEVRLLDGDSCFVASLNVPFTYYEASTSPVDNVNVIDGPGSIGRWLRGVPIGSVEGSGPAWSLKAFGAKGDGVTDDTAAMQAAITALASKTLYVPAGTYVIDTVSVPTSLTIEMDGGATLFHKSSSANDMIVFTGSRLSIRGGAIDGNQSGQSFSRVTVRAQSLTSGKIVEVEGVRFVRTRAAAILAYSFGGKLFVDGCSFSEMAEHDGTLQHATCAVTVQSGEVGGPEANADSTTTPSSAPRLRRSRVGRRAAFSSPRRRTMSRAKGTSRRSKRSGTTSGGLGRTAPGTTSAVFTRTR